MVEFAAFVARVGVSRRQCRLLIPDIVFRHMPHLLIIEPNLGSAGHWQSMIEGIGRLAAERGWSASCLGGLDAASNAQHLRVVPFFSDPPRGWLGPAAGEGDIDAIRASNDRLYEDLSAADPVLDGKPDLVIVPACTVWNALGIARWIAPRLTQVIVQLLVPDFIDLETDEVDGRIEIYREAVNTVLDSGAPPPLIWTESPLLGDRLRSQVDSRVRIERAPLLSSVEAGLAIREAALPVSRRPTLVGKIGRQHPDTGLYVVPRVVRGVLRRQRAGARFVIQCAPYPWQEASGQGPALAKIGRLARLPQVEVLSGQLDSAAWMRTLAALDNVFLPYARRFRYQSSGVFRESLALGIVTVVPEGSSMEADAKEFGAGVALFKPDSARSMIRALDRAVGSHTLASHAERAAVKFRRATDPETRFDSLLSSA